MSSRTLAQGPIARVDREGDGHLVVHVGPVAVRLTASAAASFARTLAEAMLVIELDAGVADHARSQRAFRSQS